MGKRKPNKSELAAINSLAMKQYKVSVLTVALHNFTVMAMSPEDAQQKVTQPEPGAPPAGRDAGKEGPVPFSVRVHDMSQIETQPITLQRMMQEMMGAMRETVSKEQPESKSSVIQVVGE